MTVDIYASSPQDGLESEAVKPIDLINRHLQQFLWGVRVRDFACH